MKKNPADCIKRLGLLMVSSFVILFSGCSRSDQQEMVDEDFFEARKEAIAMGIKNSHYKKPAKRIGIKKKEQLGLLASKMVAPKADFFVKPMELDKKAKIARAAQKKRGLGLQSKGSELGIIRAKAPGLSQNLNRNRSFKRGETPAGELGRSNTLKGAPSIMSSHQRKRNSELGKTTFASTRRGSLNHGYKSPKGRRTY